MTRFPYLRRHVSQIFPTVGLGARSTARSNLASEPDGNPSALQYNSLTTGRSQLSVLNYAIAQKRSIHIDPGGTESKSVSENSETVRTEEPTAYRNKRGEEV